jgi:hypothetical protein
MEPIKIIAYRLHYIFNRFYNLLMDKRDDFNKFLLEQRNFFNNNNNPYIAPTSVDQSE